MQHNDYSKVCVYMYIYLQDTYGSIEQVECDMVQYCGDQTTVYPAAVTSIACTKEAYVIVGRMIQ